MEVSRFTYPKERVRWAVWTFFLAQGLCFSTWASRIPDIKALFVAEDMWLLGRQVDDVLFWSWVLFLIPAGKFVALPAAGWLISRLGSRVMSQASVLGYAAALLSIGWAGNVYVLGVCLFAFGVCWNLCDISLNTQGVGIERLMGRTVMATFHGGWSLAACGGALLGFLMILWGVSPEHHFSAVAVVIAATVFWGRKYLQEDVAAEAAAAPGQEERASAGLLRFVRRPEGLLLQLGLVSLFALVVESAMFDWSGFYFKSVIEAPDSLQIGFLVFMVMMATGRFLTNYAYGKLGKRRVLQCAGFLIFSGFFLSALPGGVVEAGMTVKVTVISAGFMLVGLGISCMVPTVYSLAGAKSRTPVGLAITILSAVSFVGSLLAPPLIGLLSKSFGLQYAYLAIGLLGGCIWGMTTFCRAFKN
ncbi:MAG: MFS transporter [Tannerella sp.]|jgi:MFS family permease|nr:MFS transporter [Tannerella sp.]